MSSQIGQINLFASVPAEAVDFSSQTSGAEKTTFDKALDAALQSDKGDAENNKPQAPGKREPVSETSSDDSDQPPTEKDDKDKEDVAASVVAAFLASAFPPVEEDKKPETETDDSEEVDAVESTGKASAVLNTNAATETAGDETSLVAVMVGDSQTSQVEQTPAADTIVKSLLSQSQAVEESAGAITQLTANTITDAQAASHDPGATDSTAFVPATPTQTATVNTQTAGLDSDIAADEIANVGAETEKTSFVPQNDNAEVPQTNPTEQQDESPQVENLLLEGWTNERVVNMQQAAATAVQQNLPKPQTIEESDTDSITLAGPADQIAQAVSVAQPSEARYSDSESQEGESNTDYEDIATAERKDTEQGDSYLAAAPILQPSSQITPISNPTYGVQSQATAVPVATPPLQPVQTSIAPEPVRPTSDIASNTIDQIVRSAELSAKRGVTDLTVRLDPPDLGTLHVKISMQAGTGELAASIRADISNTHNLISTNQEQIKEALQQAGLRLQQIHVQDFGGSTFQQFNSHGNGNSHYQQNQTPLPMFASLEAGAVSAAGPLVAASPISGNGLINSFA